MVKKEDSKRIIQEDGDMINYVFAVPERVDMKRLLTAKSNEEFETELAKLKVLVETIDPSLWQEMEREIRSSRE